MLADVVEHVPDGEPDLRRLLELYGVIALAHDLALASQDAIHAASHADSQPLQASSKRLDAPGLGDEVDVRVLDREVHDLHTEPIPGGHDAPLDRPVGRVTPVGWQPT